MLDVHSISLIKVEQLLKILPYYHINMMWCGKRKLINMVSIQYINTYNGSMKVNCITAKTQFQQIFGQNVFSKSFTKACPSSLARYCLVIMLELGNGKMKQNLSVGSQCVAFKCARSLTLTLWRQSNVLSGKPLPDFGCSSGGVVRRFFVCGL